MSVVCVFFLQGLVSTRVRFSALTSLFFSLSSLRFLHEQMQNSHWVQLVSRIETSCFGTDSRFQNKFFYSRAAECGCMSRLLSKIVTELQSQSVPGVSASKDTWLEAAAGRGSFGFDDSLPGMWVPGQARFPQGCKTPPGTRVLSENTPVLPTSHTNMRVRTQLLTHTIPTTRC